MTRCTWSVTRYLATVTRFFFFFDNTKMPLVGPYDLKTGLKVQIKALTSSLEHLEFIPRLLVCTLYILYGHHLSKKSKNLKKKIFFFREKFGLWVGSWGTEKCKKTQNSGVLTIWGFTKYTYLNNPTRNSG